MTLEIYHQLGHNYKWNLDSINEDQTGQGVIFGPRYILPGDLQQIDINVKNESFLDPQFYLPDQPLGNLGEYTFFPHTIAGGFESSDYLDSANQSAEQCVNFQHENGFRFMLIPTRYSLGMPTNFIESQQELFVSPFIQAIENSANDKSVILQLVLNDTMIKDAEYSTDLLNWITGIQGIDGVYLITQNQPRQKQIDDIDFLFAYLKFIDSLRNNSLKVFLGYLNTEAIVLSVADPNIVTMGSYENMRMFNVENFRIKEKKDQRGPNARLYISKLLQWVDSDYNGAIQMSQSEGVGFFDQNKYQAEMFLPSFKWHFTKPELYKHHFLVFSNQLNAISQHNSEERFGYVSDLIENAIGNHQQLKNKGVVFDNLSGGAHLPKWLTALNLFAHFKGWA